MQEAPNVPIIIFQITIFFRQNSVVFSNVFCSSFLTFFAVVFYEIYDSQYDITNLQKLVFSSKIKIKQNIATVNGLNFKLSKSLKSGRLYYDISLTLSDDELR